MAVEADGVNLLFTSRGGKQTLQNQRTYTRVYEVLTDDPLDDEQVVLNAEGIPLLGSSHEDDLKAVVVSVDAQQHDESNLIWYVTVEYDSNPPRPDRDTPDERTDLDGNPIDKQKPENPTAEPPQWTVAFEDAEEPAIEGIEVDPAGELIANLPGQWFADTLYTRGTYVKNGGDVFVETAGGIAVSASAGGPAGGGTGIADSPNAWVATTAYTPGQYATNGGNVYKCKTAGTSAGAGGPTGTDGDITDGSVVWNFVGVPAVWNFYATLDQVTEDPNFAIFKPIFNSGGLPFDPPAMTTVSRLVLSVTLNMPAADLDAEYLLAIHNAVNRVEWRGFPVRTAKIKNLTHDGGKERNGVPYLTAKWEIGINRDTWDLRLIDQGYGYIQNRTPVGGGTPVPVFKRFVDADMNPLDEPVPLNGAGQPLAPGEPPVIRRFVPRQVRIIDFNTHVPF